MILRTKRLIPALLFLLLFARAASSEPSPPPITTWSHLQARLETVLRSRCLDPARVGAQVVRVRDGSEVFSHNPDLPLKPASNQKILTSAAAFARLKPDFLFPTVFYALKPPRQGVIEGDLYIKGFGAPDLVGEFWWLMVQELHRQGLREVQGDVVGDDTYFDQETRPASWPHPAGDSWYSAPVAALSFNYDVVTVRVRPGASMGSRPLVDFIPLGGYFEVKNRATTTAGRSRLFVERRYREGINEISVRGHIRHQGGPIEVTKGVENPTGYALSAFRELATREGIRLHGSIRRGSLPRGAREIFRFESKPLAAIVRDMNKHSNNFMAEAILKTLGAELLGIPGTTDKGLQVVREYLETLGIPLEGVALADGSGLAHGNRITARTLVRTLQAMHDDFEAWPEFLASLPVAGIDGTLRKRFRQEEIRRRVRAKTGRIAGVETLSGYVANEIGETLSFAVLINRPRCGADAVKRVMDRFCGYMAENSLAGPAEAAVPSTPNRVFAFQKHAAHGKILSPPQDGVHRFQEGRGGSIGLAPTTGSSVRVVP